MVSAGRLAPQLLAPQGDAALEGLARGLVLAELRLREADVKIKAFVNLSQWI